MKINSNQLKTNCSPLKPCYIVSGDEPLLVLEACDLVRKHTKELLREVYVVNSQFDWGSLLSDIQHASLFAQTKLIEIRCDSVKVNKTLGEHIQHCIEANTLGHTLLISLPKLEAATAKTKWFAEIEKNTIFCQIWPIEREQFPEWIKQRLKAAKCPTDQRLIDALVNMSEGNLLAAHQQISILSLLPDNVDEMIQSLSDQARFTPFDWVSAVLHGDMKRSENILDHLKSEGAEPILILWALAQELRFAALAATTRDSMAQFYKSHRIWPKRQAPLGALIRRCKLPAIHTALRQCAELDKSLKGASNRNVWEQFSRISLRLCV